MEAKKIGQSEILKDFLKNMDEIEDVKKLEELIKNNKVTFKVEDKKYKVRKPTYEEQEEIEDFRKKKYLELIKDDNNMFRKQWIDLYNKKGIDIDKMEQKMVDIENKIDKLKLRLATVQSKSDIDNLTKEINELKESQAITNIERTDLLSYSIEDQLVIAVNSYYSYIILETENEKKEWVKTFNSYEDFKKSKNDKLINQTFYYTNCLIYNLPF